MRDPEFITKTTDLRDDEVQILCDAIMQDQKTTGSTLARYFRQYDRFHCFNVHPGRKGDWDHFWGLWKTRLYKRRKELAEC